MYVYIHQNFVSLTMSSRPPFMYMYQISTLIFLEGVDDYEAVSTVLTFSRDTVKCIAVSVIDDTVFEDTEIFLVTLTLSSGSNQIQLQNSEASVEIISKHIRGFGNST